MAALAEFERGLLTERTQAGLQAARRQGRVGGRPKALSPAAARTYNVLLSEGRRIAAALLPVA